MMAETGSYAERFGSNAMLNWCNLDDVADKFYGINPEKNSKTSSEIANNGLERGKNYESQTTAKTKAQIDAENKAYKELKQRVITMMRRLPTYLFIEEEKVDNIDGILYINNDELFTEAVGITLDTFKGLCEGFINVSRLNRAIMAYNQVDVT
jgi:hypothetical protein